MYTRILVPLDGSKVAEQVLPYTRWLAGALKIPVELLGVIDVVGIAASTDAARARYFGMLVEDGKRASKTYLERISPTFQEVSVKCSVETGKPEDVIIEKGASDKGTLIAMATHGRSGMNRWLLGSIAEEVLRGTSNPLLIVRAAEEGKSEGVASFKSVVVPLDGSELAETVLPGVIDLAKRTNLEVVLTRAYALPVAVYAGADDYYIPNYDELKAEVKKEALVYLEAKVNELKGKGLKVASVLLDGPAAEEIIGFARRTPDNLVAMCSHGRSGLKRWVLGSVTEKVVRHSGDPVLVIRERETPEHKGSPAHLREAEDFLKFPVD